MRPRVLIPLLLALAAVAGLVLGAVLPASRSTPTSGASSSAPGSPSPQPTALPTGSDSANASASASASATGGVMGDGGGVSAVNQPQPGFPVKKLLPGEKPPQFVVVSFDGSCNSDVFRRFMDTADATGAKYTMFLSGLCLLPEASKYLYQTPGREAGSSAIGFADNPEEVVQRIANYSEAYSKGHEIGTHFLGHWCDPSEGSVNSWNASEWESEFSQDAKFMNDWAAINGVTDPQVLPFNHSVVQVARTPCLEGQRDVMFPIFVEHGFTYDASGTGEIQWPSRNEYGLWEFPLQDIKVAGFPGQDSLSMDYNLVCQQNGSGGSNCNDSTDPAICQQAGQSTYQSLMDALDATYNDTRAPIFWGMHWKPLMCGAYIDAVNQFIADASAQYPDVQFVSFADLVKWLNAQDLSTIKQLQAQGAQQY